MATKKKKATPKKAKKAVKKKTKKTKVVKPKKAAKASNEETDLDFTLIEVGTGTPFGLSHYQKVYDCGKRAHLDHEFFRDGTASLLGDYYQNVGSIVHGLLKPHYQTGLYNVDKVRYNKKVQDRERKAAEKIYRKYRLKYPPDFWGKVVEVEQPYGLARRGAQQQRRAIADAVGAAPLPYTFQPDLVVYLTKADLKRINVARGLSLKREGFYLVDFKTYGNEWGLEEDRYLWGLQGTAYPLGWEAANKKKPVGIIFDLIGRDETDETIFQPYPSPPRIRRLHDWFKLIKRHIEAHGPQFANPNNCFTKDVCPHWSRGACPGF